MWYGTPRRWCWRRKWLREGCFGRHPTKVLLGSSHRCYEVMCLSGTEWVGELSVASSDQVGGTVVGTYNIIITYIIYTCRPICTIFFVHTGIYVFFFVHTVCFPTTAYHTVFTVYCRSFTIWTCGTSPTTFQPGAPATCVLYLHAWAALAQTSIARVRYLSNTLRA